MLTDGQTELKTINQLVFARIFLPMNGAMNALTLNLRFFVPERGWSYAGSLGASARETLGIRDNQTHATSALQW